MNTAVVALFVAGLVFLGFEVLAPGAILGVLAGLCLLAGVVLAFASHGMEGGLVATAVALFAVGALMYFELRILPRTRMGRKMFLEKAIEGASQPPVATEADKVIGRDAVALTALSPTGLVEVAGKRYEARCNSGFADAGTRLRVVRIETFQLVVIASD